MRRCRAAAVALAAMSLFMIAHPASAAELEGVRMPDTIEVEGTKLHLNGIGLRTFSLFEVQVYIAGLYLTHPSRDSEAILDSPDIKVLDVHFIHDASADRVRDAWQEGFDSDCVAPCHLPPDDLAKFLATVPALRKGDISRLIYTKDWVSISVNGKELGRVTNPAFRRVLLATFIGKHPPTERLKRELLAGGVFGTGVGVAAAAQ